MEICRCQQIFRTSSIHSLILLNHEYMSLTGLSTIAHASFFCRFNLLLGFIFGPSILIGAGPVTSFYQNHFASGSMQSSLFFFFFRFPICSLFCSLIWSYNPFFLCKCRNYPCIIYQGWLGEVTIIIIYWNLSCAQRLWCAHTSNTQNFF